MVASFVVMVGSSFLFTLRVSILWLSHSQFVQCLPFFHVFIYDFVVRADVEICGANNAL
jgi:hypothetical protein